MSLTIRIAILDIGLGPGQKAIKNMQFEFCLCVTITKFGNYKTEIVALQLAPTPLISSSGVALRF